MAQLLSPEAGSVCFLRQISAADLKIWQQEPVLLLSKRALQSLVTRYRGVLMG